MNPIAMQLVADKYICLVLEENISSEDAPINSVTPEYRKGEVQLTCREDGIIAGLQIFEYVLILLDPGTRVAFDVKDGEEVKKDQHPATTIGDVRVLLSGKQTAPNHPQRPSGIATYIYTVAGMLEGTGIRLPDTRRVTSCMYISEKYAVWVGGGQNHHYDLSDGVLLKDNHIDTAEGVREVVTATKAYAPFVRRIEVGTENLDMVKETMDAGADIIMLDNTTPERMAEVIRHIGGRAETECFGSMIKENTRTITELGVDYVSSGALTHSSPILGISPKRLEVSMD